MFDRLSAPIASLVSAHLGVPEAQIRGLFAPPAKGVAGDLALPCFQLAKLKGVPPPAMAVELAGVLAAAGVAAVAAGPFCNVTFAAAAVAEALLPALAGSGAAAVRSTIGAGQRVCIDYSSPNIAKHLAFHHIRSTMIGNALAHCYAAAGWDVKRINFIGDWGTAFGRLIAGWKREGLTLVQLQAADDQVTFLNDLYVRISNAAKADPVVEEEARQWSKALEDGNPEARDLWQIFKDASLKEFERVYGLLGVRFDSWKGEAYYEDKMGPLLAELESKGLTSQDQGATVVDLPKLLNTEKAKTWKKPALIKRADGGTLYATRDLTACDDRFREFAFARSLYVVDLGQSLHFQEWFAVAKLLQRPFADKLRHIGFGVVLIWNDEENAWAKGRTRGGKIMLLREVLDEAVERAAAIVAEKNPELPADERAAIARAVGVGAVVFNDLKNGRTGDVKFKFEEALRFDGETGPYLQFAHARMCSIERKAEHRRGGNPALLTSEAEKQVLLAIARLQGALERAVDTDEPSVLAQALLSLASNVASWLTSGNADLNARVLCADAAIAASRLQLVTAARGALGEGLRLLGLVAPERM
jgi:arginyl-tRNA synthetase